MSKTLWHTIKLEVPKEMVNITKNDKVVVKKTKKLLNVVVVVAFKLLILKIELVDNEFKLLNVVVVVEFKLLIDNVE